MSRIVADENTNDGGKHELCGGLSRQEERHSGPKKNTTEV